MVPSIKVGAVVGTGVAIDVELGWVPDYVEVTNLTDGDLITKSTLFGERRFMAFSSGGTTEIVAGNKVTGATSGATAIVDEVLLASGTWAGGDAAGFFMLRDIYGTFGSENVSVDGASNLATVTAPQTASVAIAAAATGATGNAAVTPLAGTREMAKGFTIGSTVAEAGKLLGYLAIRTAQ